MGGFLEADLQRERSGGVEETGRLPRLNTFLQTDLWPALLVAVQDRSAVIEIL
jgi:hypothetical protein